MFGIYICRMVWLLEDYYDHEHRAYLMAEKHMAIKPWLNLFVFIFLLIQLCWKKHNVRSCMYAEASSPQASVSWRIFELHAVRRAVHRVHPAARPPPFHH